MVGLQDRYLSLLRQMAAQKQENHSRKMKNIHNYRRKIKRKTIKSKSEYASRASPNGPLNIYVADMPWKNMIDWKQSLGLIQMQSANDSQDNVSATYILTMPLQTDRTSIMIYQILLYSTTLNDLWPHFTDTPLFDVETVETAQKPYKM